MGLVLYLPAHLQEMVGVQLLTQIRIYCSPSALGSTRLWTLCLLPAFQGTQTPTPAGSNELSILIFEWEPHWCHAAPKQSLLVFQLSLSFSTKNASNMVAISVPEVNFWEALESRLSSGQPSL